MAKARTGRHWAWGRSRPASSCTCRTCCSSASKRVWRTSRKGWNLGRVGPEAPATVARVTARLLQIASAAAVIVAFGASGAPARSAGPAWPYTVYRPASLAKTQPVPLVVVPGGSISDMQRMTNFNQAADRGGFVVVYPQIVKSYNDVAHAQGETAANPYPDMLFLSDVIDKVTAAENIDPKR